MSECRRKISRLVGVGLSLMLIIGMFPSVVAAASANKQMVGSFPTDKVLDVQIQMAEADLTHLLANPTQEVEYGGSINWNGKQINNVSVRTKGNSSLSSVARSNSQRFSLKIDLNHYVKGQNLDGITTINLNNGFKDASFMREYLSYEAFASLSVPVPARSWVQLTINDQLWGLYLAVEQIGTPFLERNFDTGKGSLYKPDLQHGQGADLKWYGDQYANYPGIVAKTEVTNSNHEPLLAMLAALNNGGNLEQHLDVEGILRYLAVSTVLVNFDSYQGGLAHNYYLYEQDGRFTIIPWDLNESFGLFSMGMTADQLIGVKIDEPVMGAVVDRPLIAKLLAVQEYRDRYHGYVQDLIKGYVEPARLEARALHVAALIDSYVKADPTKMVTYEQFKQSLAAAIPTGLLTLMRLRVPNVQQQLDGTLPSKGDGSGIGVQGGGPGARPGVRPAGPGGQRPGQPPGGVGLPPGAQIGGPGQVNPPGGAEIAPMASPVVSADLVIPLVAAVGLVLGATAFIRFRRPRYSKP